MANTLVAPIDLADFPGAPFSDALVDAAASAVRGETGWHIAPAVTETVVVESVGGPHLFLPTLQLTAVTAVRDVTDEDAAAVAVTGWRSHKTPRFRAGVLFRPSGWYGVYEVDITHGYAACPDDLKPALAAVIKAAREGGRVSSFSLGDLSRSFERGDSTSPLAAIGRYKIPWRP
jgi:hypothetical protein